MNPRTSPPNSSPLAIAAIVLPLVIGGCGVVTIPLAPKSEGDWFGGAFIIWVGGAFALAAITSVGCAIGSFIRREPNASRSLWLAVPGGIFLLTTIAGFASARLAEGERLKQDDLRRRILADAEFRHAFIMDPKLTVKDANLFKGSDVADLLTTDEVRQLWERCKHVQTGWNKECLMLSKNTPPDVLMDFYQMELNAAAVRPRPPQLKELWFPTTFLNHRNLPPEIAAELSRAGNASYLEALAERARRSR